MLAGDLAGVMKVAAAAFPDHHEDVERFAERLEASPSLCFVLAGDSGIAGYLVAYPWSAGSIPPLNRRLEQPSRRGDAVFLHDLAVQTGASGGGHASAILPLLADCARAIGARSIALVAVNDSAGFWLANGFSIVDVGETLREKLESYGRDARYMVRQI